MKSTFKILPLAGAVALLLNVACDTHTAPDVSHPSTNVLPGTWSEVIYFPGVTENIQLSVNDTVLTGTGTYTIEAGLPGTLTVRGSAVNDKVAFELTRSDGLVHHFNGTLLTPDSIAGYGYYSGTVYIQDPVGTSYHRVH